MTYQSATQSMDWIRDNIADPTPMNDKSRLHEMMDVLSHDGHSDAEKGGALKALGFMSIRYGAFFVIMCGIIPVIKQYLVGDNKPLAIQAARSLKYIAQSGGCEELIQENIHEDLRLIITDISKNQDLRDICATAYGWMVSNPPTEINPDMII
jgi:hypothetical protein